MGFQVSFHSVTDQLQVGTKDMSFLEDRSPHWEYIPGTVSISGPSYFNNTPNIGIAQASVMIGPPEFECNEGKKQELDHEFASKLKGQQLAYRLMGSLCLDQEHQNFIVRTFIIVKEPRLLLLKDML